jgi:uncharacterized membrane protein YjjP (DUF1212 family)
MMQEFEDLMKGFQTLKTKSMQNLEKLQEINPVLFAEISNDLSTLETSKDISEIQKIQQKYASTNS